MGCERRRRRKKRALWEDGSLEGLPTGRCYGMHEREKAHGAVWLLLGSRLAIPENKFT